MYTESTLINRINKLNVAKETLLNMIDSCPSSEGVHRLYKRYKRVGNLVTTLRNHLSRDYFDAAVYAQECKDYNL